MIIEYTQITSYLFCVILKVIQIGKDKLCNATMFVKTKHGNSVILMYKS